MKLNFLKERIAQNRQPGSDEPEFIPFNKPHLTGKELAYIQEAVETGKISGNGLFTQKCRLFLEKEFGFQKVLLTSSCTDALEMAALLSNINPGDEVITPSFSFVSPANAFVLRGAKIIFADSSAENPNIDPDEIEALITPRTKAVVIIHYAGVACNMDRITAITNKHNLALIEDAAQAFGATHNGRPLGTFGRTATFSFHETKNIISGEGGMLVVNDQKDIARAEIIWEKGTDRAAFFRGEIDKYTWRDVGSSFLPSEITTAFLYAQLENSEQITERRKALWSTYFEGLSLLENAGYVSLPNIPEYAGTNGNIFYLICASENERERLIDYLNDRNIKAVFHYPALHRSPFYKEKHSGRKLPQTDKYAERLVRIPLYPDLKNEEIMRVIEAVIGFYKN